jgi:hypothetical protein
MKKTICDLCGEDEGDHLTVEVLDGKHPHGGSRMYKEIDVCIYCLKTIKMDLKSDEEFCYLEGMAKKAKGL